MQLMHNTKTVKFKNQPGNINVPQMIVVKHLFYLNIIK